jgi:exopolysaccharide biosynthesis protein
LIETLVDLNVVSPESGMGQRKGEDMHLLLLLLLL